MNKSFSVMKNNTLIFDKNSTHPMEEFNVRYEMLLREGILEDVIELLETFFMIYPLRRLKLLEIYSQNMTIYGDSQLAHEAVRVYMEVCEKLMAIGQEKYNSPLFVSSLTPLLGRVGELADQSAMTLLLKKLGRIPCKPVLFSVDSLPIINNAFQPYLEDCFEVVYGSAHKDYAQKTNGSCPYVSYVYKFSDTQYGHNTNFFTDCYPDLLSGGLNSQPFKLKDITIGRAINFLKSYGVRPDDDFVVLHLREEG